MRGGMLRYIIIRELTLELASDKKAARGL